MAKSPEYSYELEIIRETQKLLDKILTGFDQNKCIVILTGTNNHDFITTIPYEILDKIHKFIIFDE